MLVGGGEDLAFNREAPIQSLRAIINDRADYLVRTIDAFLATFITEVGKAESQ